MCNLYFCYYYFIIKACTNVQILSRASAWKIQTAIYKDWKATIIELSIKYTLEWRSLGRVGIVQLRNFHFLFDTRP